MVIKTGDNGYIFETWADNCTAISKMWEEYYFKVYKPWLESTAQLFEKAIQIPKETSPEKYKEFYDEWVKTYQDSLGKFYQIPTPESCKETLEKLMAGAEESNKIYRSWINELEENSRHTREVLRGEPDTVKYKEVYDRWIKFYGKLLDELLTMPFRVNIKESFENYTCLPYSGTFEHMAKLWKNTCTRLWQPCIESGQMLSAKMAEISRGDASQEAYEEFYKIWMETYNETYSKYVQSMPSKEAFGRFAESTNIYLSMYKSWISALEKIAEKAEELSTKNINPAAAREFYNIWIKMYEKAFDAFFEDMPVAGPMKEMMEPVKITAKIYTETFAGMSRMWVKPDRSATAYPGKYRS